MLTNESVALRHNRITVRLFSKTKIDVATDFDLLARMCDVCMQDSEFAQKSKWWLLIV